MLPKTRQCERWLRILKYCSKLDGPLRRRRATTKVYAKLRRDCDLKGGIVKIRLPPFNGCSRRTQGKRIVDTLLKKYRSSRPQFARFMSRRIRILDVKARTMGDVRTNCRKVSKTASFGEVGGSSLAQIEEWRLGKDIVVRDENWKVPIGESRTHVEKRWARSLGDLQKHFSLPTEVEADVGNLVKIEVDKEFRSRVPQSREFVKHDARCRGGDDVVVAPRDGDTNRRYIRSRGGFLMSMLLLFVSRPQEYEFVINMTRTEAAKHLGEEALEYLASSLLRGWRGNWGIHQIPYFYSYCKPHCYPSGLFCCSKLHAHGREIVAKCNIPRAVKMVLLWIAKAIRVILKRFPPCRLWRLASFSSLLTQGTEGLKSVPDFLHRCICCGEQKAGLEGVGGDANSYYKKIQRSRIIEALSLSKFRRFLEP